MAFDELKLAHKVRAIFNLTLRGSTHEREAARQRLEDLLAKHRLTLGDVERLIALSVSASSAAPSAPADNGDVEPAPAAGKVPDVFELVDWVLRRFLYLRDSEGRVQDHYFTAIALWILHTFVVGEFDHTPRLALLSPVRGCGKSLVLDLCERLCLRPRKLGSATTAVLPRLTRDRSTVLLDEADNLDFAHDPILRAVLNDGFTAGARRGLLAKGDVAEFDLFAAVALGAIGRLPLPLMSRSIVIHMTRAPRRLKLERFGRNNLVQREELDVVYRHTFAWAQGMRGKFNTDPEMPSGFYGRLADRWRALISIADALGHGEKARAAARVFAAEHSDEDVKVLLLADIRRVFVDDQISAESLLKQLLGLDDALWSEFRGEHGDQAPKPLTRPTMTKMISAFGIRTRTIWPRHRTAETKSERGYHKGQYESAWASYCDDNTATQPSVVRHLRRG
jgi:hypothetical protein